MIFLGLLWYFEIFGYFRVHKAFDIKRAMRAKSNF